MKPIDRATLALEGLSIGDAFGQMFFGKEDVMLSMIDLKALPAPPWYLTDDSIMAIGILETLQAKGQIDQDYLAECFASNYKRNPRRGYGGMAHQILRSLHQGEDWRIVAPSVFDGMGSFGNGGAMRVAPLGAYFSDDIEQLCQQAILSAEVTHSHIDGQAGTIAIAAAASWAWNHRDVAEPDGKAMMKFVLELLPECATKAGVQKAYELPLDYSIETVASIVGNGTMVSSQDTVPFSLWCAARHLDDFEAALWSTVSALGDRDTTCAIVGGIVALKVGYAGLPQEWQAARESLTTWESAEVNWDF
jgi:ADP-ribosylglycohydrolase